MKPKKWLSLFLILCLVLSGLPVPQAYAVQFNDIQNHWAYNSIIRAVEQNLFVGVSDTAFAPDATLTRGMFVTILAKYHGHDPSSYNTAVFSDVAADSWYGPAVAWAAQNGIVSGTSGYTFSPELPITREQIAVMMVGYANFTGRVLPRVRLRKTFNDFSACADYALDAICTCYRAGMISGMGNDLFAPKSYVTRAQCAVIMCTYIDLCSRNYTNPERVFLVNHRGYNVTAPENTLPSFQMSATMGYTAVETDIQFTRDNVPVLLHDSTIQRTSNGSGAVSDMTYQQLQTYDFGAWKSDIYAGTKIPTFEQFISLCQQLGLKPFIELKGNLSRANAKILIDIVSKYGMLDNVTWLGFSYSTNLASIAAWDGTASLGLLTTEISSVVIQRARNLQNGKNYVFLAVENDNLTTAERVMSLRNGFDYGVWCVDDRLSGIRAVNSSTEFIITDNLRWDALY